MVGRAQKTVDARLVGTAPILRIWDAALFLRSLNDLFITDGTRCECALNARFKFWFRALGDIGHGTSIRSMAEAVHFDRSLLPPKELEAARSIEMNLMSLLSLAEQFRETAELYLFAHTQKLIEDTKRRDIMSQISAGGIPDGQMEPLIFEFVGWIKIAGAHGAIIAHSFFKLMEAIGSTKAPTIWAKADLREKRAATKLFANEFPQVAHVRKSAAHPGELSKNPLELDRHAARKAVRPGTSQLGAGTYVEGHMHGMNDHLMYGSTVEGEFVEYELSLRKARALREAVILYSRAFYPLENATAAQQRAWMLESDERHRQDQKSRPPWWHSLLRL